MLQVDMPGVVEPDRPDRSEARCDKHRNPEPRCSSSAEHKAQRFPVLKWLWINTY